MGGLSLFEDTPSEVVLKGNHKEHRCAMWRVRFLKKDTPISLEILECWETRRASKGQKWIASGQAAFLPSPPKRIENHTSPLLSVSPKNAAGLPCFRSNRAAQKPQNSQLFSSRSSRVVCLTLWRNWQPISQLLPCKESHRNLVKYGFSPFLLHAIIFWATMQVWLPRPSKSGVAPKNKTVARQSEDNFAGGPTVFGTLPRK